MSRLLKQEEIDALLNSQNDEPDQPEEAEGDTSEEQVQENLAGDEVIADQARENLAGDEVLAEQSSEPVTAPVQGQTAINQESLTEEEIDALGEVGNICMGSAATTLSMLLNQKVSITSPSVTISTLEELFDGFQIPHMSIYVRFIEGITGFNLLIIKVHDANVLADLMMGGTGTDISEEINEIGLSAASEAMNQMIGTASTSMATMFNRTVNISPPITKVYHSAEDLTSSEFGVEGPVVVVWFKMAIGDILDTQIMQVMGFDTAREEAALILGELMQPNMEMPELAAEEKTGDDLSGSLDEWVVKDDVDRFGDVKPEPDPRFEQDSQYGSPVAETPSPNPVSVRPTPLRVETTTSGFDEQRLDLILDIPLKVTVLLGRTRWPIKDILGLSPGSVVEMQSLADEPVEVLVNGTLVATGEVVVVNENFGVRITSIVGPRERIQNLGT